MRVLDACLLAGALVFCFACGQEARAQGGQPVNVRAVDPADLPPGIRNPPKNLLERLERLGESARDQFKQAKERAEKNLGPDGKPVPPPPFTFEARCKDIGRVRDDDDVTIQWEFLNSSGQSVKILQLKSTSGALVPRDDKAVIEAGERGIIVATFKPVGRLGQEFREIEVTTDFLAAPRFKVGVLVETLARVMIDPPRLTVGKVRKGQTAEKEFAVYGREADFDVTAFRLVGATPAHAITRLGTSEVKLPDGESARKVAFLAKLNGTPPVGNYDDEVEIATTDAKRAKAPMMLSSEVQGDIRIAARLRLGGNAAKPGDAWLGQAKLTHRDVKPFVIKSVKVEGVPDAWKIVLDVRTLDDSAPLNPEAGYLVKVGGSVPKGDFVFPTGAKLVIETDVDQQERIEIPFTGGPANVGK